MDDFSLPDYTLDQFDIKVCPGKKGTALEGGIKIALYPKNKKIHLSNWYILKKVYMNFLNVTGKISSEIY